MRLTGSDNLLLGALVVLAVSSVGLKAAVGPANDGGVAGAGQVEQQLTARLNTQGFSTRMRPFKHRTALLLGERGDCRIAVRDARGGAAFMAAFARDAAPIGPVRYVYADGSYSSPPTVRLRLARLSTELQTRLGFRPSVHVPLALAASPECGSGTFGLGDVRIES